MFNSYAKNLYFRHNKQEVDSKGRKINTASEDIFFTGLLFVADHETVEDIRYRDVTHICIAPYTYLKNLDIDDYIIDGDITYIITDFGTSFFKNRQILYLKKVTK